MTDVLTSWQVGIPAAPLRPFVDAYIGYRGTFPSGVHRGLPSGQMTFIVSLADDIEVLRQVDPRQAPARYGCVIGGLHTTPALIARGGYEEGIAIGLEPVGSRALLGLPAAELAGLTVDAPDVLGARLASELRSRLHARTTWQKRFEALDDLLLQRLGERSQLPHQVRHAWSLLKNSGGRASIGALADEVGWSRRHLGAVFGREFGVTPKAAARAIRFGRVVGHLRRQAVPDLAATAAVCGYADQPHFTREFAAMAGCTPTTWLAEEFPSLQDTESVARHG